MGKGGCITTPAVTTEAAVVVDDIVVLSSTSQQQATNNNSNNKVKNNNNNFNLRPITHNELSEKNTINECWIAYDGIVYDITHWIPKHPGGIRTIMTSAGKDSTSIMKSLHKPSTISKYMKRIRKVGILVDNDNNDNHDEIASAASTDVSSTDNDSDIDTISSSSSSDLVVEQEEEDAADDKTTTTTSLKKTLTVKERNDAINKDFYKLNEKLINEGWYEPMPLHYWACVIRAALLIIGGVNLVLFASNNINNNDVSDISSLLLSYGSLVVGSIMMGLFFQNIAFIGHDAGHGSITNSITADNCLGFIVGNLLTGIDIGWWKSTHYVHHSATNSINHDPDIQHLPILCFDLRMDGIWSTYHGRTMLLDTIGKMIIPYQHYYYLPVMSVARFFLYIHSILYLISTCPFIPNFDNNNKDKKSNKKSSTTTKEEEEEDNNNNNDMYINKETGEIKEIYAWPKPSILFWSTQVLCLIGYYSMWYKFYCSINNPYVFGTCLIITKIVTGILHIQIILSHLAMDYCIDAKEQKDNNNNQTKAHDDKDITYYEWQALSTMDIDCPPWMDWFHGGLQFQLEHHLFPRVQRWRLRKLIPLVDEIFAKHNIPVIREPFIDANIMVMKHLAKVGKEIASSASGGNSSLSNNNNKKKDQ